MTAFSLLETAANNGNDFHNDDRTKCGDAGVRVEIEEIEKGKDLTND